MKTKKSYILVGNYENMGEAVRILEEQNIAYVVDERHVGQKINNKIPIIGLHDIAKLSNSHIVVDIGRSGEGYSPVLKDLKIRFMTLNDAVSDYFFQEAQYYDQLNKRENFRFQKDKMYPCLKDKGANAGTTGLYFWQDLWGARHVFQKKPKIHYDIGSSVGGFVAHLVSFNQEVCLLDIRPLTDKIPGVSFIQCDATKMENIEEESIESLSALCSLEHFGLGRYGDPIDPEACFICFKEIEKRMKKGGMFYMSVPIGQEHVEFNAHRVYYPTTIKDSFSNMKLVEFSVTWGNSIEKDVPINKYDDYTGYGGGCVGLFAFEKL